MNFTTEEHILLKQENLHLKQLNNKLKKRLKGSILKTDLECFLEILIPQGSEDDYIVFMDLNNSVFNSYKELIDLVTFLIKVDRVDLAYLYVHKNFLSINYREQNPLDVEAAFKKLVKQLLIKNKIEELHLQLLFELLSIKKEHLFPIYKEVFTLHMDELIKASLVTRNDDWILRLLYFVRIIDKKLLDKAFEYLHEHWDLLFNWISEEELFTWGFLVDISGHVKFQAKLKILNEYYQLKKEGMSLQPIEASNYGGDEKNNKKTGFAENWKEVSDLRKYGYEVSDKSDIERWIAIHKAMRNIPISKIVSHIQWLLDNSYRRDGLNRDFSKSIKAYETDLEYLENYFSTRNR